MVEDKLIFSSIGRSNRSHEFRAATKLIKVLVQVLHANKARKNMNRRRGPVITQQWLADFYANGVQGKYKASIKKAAQENNNNKKDKKEKK